MLNIAYLKFQKHWNQINRIIMDNKTLVRLGILIELTTIKELYQQNAFINLNHCGIFWPNSIAMCITILDKR